MARSAGGHLLDLKSPPADNKLRTTLHYMSQGMGIGIAIGGVGH